MRICSNTAYQRAHGNSSLLNPMTRNQSRTIRVSPPLQKCNLCKCEVHGISSRRLRRTTSSLALWGGRHNTLLTRKHQPSPEEVEKVLPARKCKRDATTAEKATHSARCLSVRTVCLLEMARIIRRDLTRWFGRRQFPKLPVMLAGFLRSRYGPREGCLDPP